MTMRSLRLMVSGWWESKSPPDRRILGAAGMLLACAVWFGLIWAPLTGVRQDVQTDISRLAVAEAQLAALPANQVRLTGPGADIRDRLTATAAAQGLVVSRLETSDGSVAVSFEYAPFDTLASWIGELEQQQGIKVVGASLKRLPEPGTVAAELELKVR